MYDVLCQSRQFFYAGGDPGVGGVYIPAFSGVKRLFTMAMGFTGGWMGWSGERDGNGKDGWHYRAGFHEHSGVCCLLLGTVIWSGADCSHYLLAYERSTYTCHE